MYLILFKTKIIDNSAVEPVLDGTTLTWGKSRMSGATYAYVPDGTWSPSDGYDKTWDGSTIGTYTPPAEPEVPRKDLTEAEFIKLGYAIDPDGVDAALKDMPGLQRLLAQYTNTPGLKYEDAIDPKSALNGMLRRIVSKGHLSQNQVQTLQASWPT